MHGNAVASRELLEHGTRHRTSTSRITVYQLTPTTWSLVNHSKDGLAREAILLSGYWVEKHSNGDEPLIRGCIGERAWTANAAIAHGIVLVVEPKLR